jgi:hypothetical protein
MAAMWPDRRLIDLFDIEHPLVLAPMAGLGTATMGAAVCAGVDSCPDVTEEIDVDR